MRKACRVALGIATLLSSAACTTFGTDDAPEAGVPDAASIDAQADVDGGELAPRCFDFAGGATNGFVASSDRGGSTSASGGGLAVTFPEDPSNALAAWKLELAGPARGVHLTATIEVQLPLPPGLGAASSSYAGLLAVSAVIADEPSPSVAFSLSAARVILNVFNTSVNEAPQQSTPSPGNLQEGGTLDLDLKFRWDTTSPVSWSESSIAPASSFVPKDGCLGKHGAPSGVVVTLGGSASLVQKARTLTYKKVCVTRLP